jgi:hypothetical protein
MRSLSKCLLIIISIAISTIASAGSLIELKTQTIPCEGCYFAVFDKIKKNYKLTYITPKIPNMADIVKNKQEVLWIDSNGDYSPYWNWTRKGVSEDSTSFSFGECSSQLIGKGDVKYECESVFWSNTVVGDAISTLGIMPALYIGLSPLTGGVYGYGVKINKQLVEKIKIILDKSDIAACDADLLGDIYADNIVNVNSSGFSDVVTDKNNYIYKSGGLTVCFDASNYKKVTNSATKKYAFFPSINQSERITDALIFTRSNNNYTLEIVNFNKFSSSCFMGKNDKYSYLDFSVDDFDDEILSGDILIYKNKSDFDCIDTSRYHVRSESKDSQGVTFLISKDRRNAIIITKKNANVRVENIDLFRLSDEDLFWFYKKINPNIFADKNIVISLYGTKYVDWEKQQTLSDLNLKVEEAVQKFLSIPLVREPSLPPTPTLLKGEFEKEAAFKERVLLEINKREAQVIALQEKYRADVEARNTEVEKRINAKDSYADFISRKYFESLMGGVMLKNAHYDPEKEMMYADLVSARSDFSRPLAIPIPLANNEAETIKRYIDSDYKSLGINAKFSVDRNGIILNEVELFANGKPYIAQFQAEKFSPKIVKVTLPDTQTKLDTLFQNPNLADLITIPKLSFAAKTADGSIVFDDDLANDVEKLSAAPEDAKKWLFLVAVENYKETDNVLFAKHSADLLATTLKKRLGVSNRNAYVLIDGNATAGAISDKLEQMLANIKADDTIYFYYSGHGVPDPVTTEPYILPSDKVVDFIVREKQFQLGDIYRRLSLSGAGKVVAFVDSCFSGRTDNASIFKGTAPGLIRVKELDIDPTKMTVLTAGKNTQFSNAYDTKGHRMFSYFLIRSLLKSRTNTPDMNTIFQEVSVGVRDASSAKGDIYLQEPQMYGNSALPL